MSTPSSTTRTLKIVMMGASGVGKSHIMTRLVDRTFYPGDYPTIGVDYRFTRWANGQFSKQHGSDKADRVQIWDLSGNPRFETITDAYCKGADAVALVWSPDKVGSFQELIDRFLPMVQSHCPQGCPVMILTHNMTSMYTHGSRSVLLLPSFAVNASTGEGIDHAFDDLCRRVTRVSNKDMPTPRTSLSGLFGVQTEAASSNLGDAARMFLGKMDAIQTDMDERKTRNERLKAQLTSLVSDRKAFDKVKTGDDDQAKNFLASFAADAERLRKLAHEMQRQESTDDGDAPTGLEAKLVSLGANRKADEDKTGEDDQACHRVSLAASAERFSKMAKKVASKMKERQSRHETLEEGVVQLIQALVQKFTEKAGDDGDDDLTAEQALARTRKAWRKKIGQEADLGNRSVVLRQPDEAFIHDRKSRGFTSEITDGGYLFSW